MSNGLTSLLNFDTKEILWSIRFVFFSIFSLTFYKVTSKSFPFSFRCIPMIIILPLQNLFSKSTFKKNMKNSYSVNLKTLHDIFLPTFMIFFCQRVIFLFFPTSFLEACKEFQNKGNGVFANRNNNQFLKSLD